MLYRVSAFVSYCFFKIFFSLEIKGKDAFSLAKPFILASNHLSNLDPPVLAVSCPQRISFLAKEELFSNKVFAWYLKAVGAIPLKRGKSDLRTIRLALKTLKSKALLIFPQGTREADFNEVNPGLGFLYKKARVAVIAGRIYGTDKVLPKGAKFFRKGKIKVVFAKVDTLSQNDTYQDISRKVMEVIKNL